MSAPNNVCGLCLGSGEVFQARVAVIDRQYRTVHGFVPCPQCGDPEQPARQHPTPSHRRSPADE